MTIDAEIHFWKYNKALNAPLIRNEKKMQEDMLPATVQLNLKRNGMDGCVAVAAEPTEVETRFLSELMRTNEMIRGVVGWIDMTMPQVAEKINELSAAYPEIRGFKTRFPEVLAKDILPALAAHGFPLDITLPKEINGEPLRQLVNAWPEQSFIISDCGSPEAAKPPSDNWLSMMRSLAACPNVYVKVSGLFTQAAWNKWRPADFYPFLETLFAGFGAGRLLYSSDWPFILLSGSYVQWKSMLDKFTGHLDEDSRNDFYGGNATRLYRL